jgi:neutral ceramidase
MPLVKRFLRVLRFILLSLIALLLVFLAVSIAPLDRTPITQYDVYQRMMTRLDSLHQYEIPAPKHAIASGFGKVNITPSFKTATAGYGKRRGKLFSAVHDSIFIRAIVLDNGSQKVAIVSADLLIIPPSVTQLLKTRLPKIGFTMNSTYLGAIHSHNSIGNWAKGAAGLLYGSYEEKVVNLIVDGIIESIKLASENVLPSKIFESKISVPLPVENRLVTDGPEDPYLRSLEIRRSDRTKALLMTYTAHATCLFSADMELSRDYPGKLVDVMEANGYNFVMFMAGAVGSHGCHSPKASYQCIDWMAESISEKFASARDSSEMISDSTLAMVNIPLELGDPQMKISENWKVRSWLFRAAMGEYPVSISALRIGNEIMLATPCDYSGEFDAKLDSVASIHHKHIMVTSFNGGYIGYVTPEKYYDRNHYETQLMNWYPPGNGEYITNCLVKLVEVMED